MLHGPDRSFWSGSRVLVTGHTGFKGSWLTCWLRELGAEVHGVSLAGSHGDPCLWDQLGLDITETRADVATSGWLDDARAFAPQFVMHLAAQSLVGIGYRDPARTFATNVMGTVQVMTLLSELPDLRSAVIVTTDKVYDTRQPTPYTEAHFLGGTDPYSASKAAAELVTHAWPRSIPVGTARAGNVIGGGDWSIDRIVPDLVRAWSAGDELVLRRPGAVRPWQHVVEPLAGYLAYAEALATREAPTALNFGPDRSQAVPVGDLVAHAAAQWGRLTGSTPTWRALPEPTMLEADDLTLDPSSARRALDWAGRWDWRTAVDKSLWWYLEASRGTPPRELMRTQLAHYVRG